MNWHFIKDVFLLPFLISFVVSNILMGGTYRILKRTRGHRKTLYDAIWRLRCLNDVDYGEPCEKILCQICEAKATLAEVPR